MCEVAGWNGAEVQLNRIFVAGPDGRALPQPHLTDLRRQKLRERGFEDHLLLDAGGWWDDVSRPRCSARSSEPASGSACSSPSRGWFGVLERPQQARRRAAPRRRRPRSPRGSVWRCSASSLAGWLTGWVAAMAPFGLLGWMIPSFVGLRASRRRQLARSEAIAVWAEMLRDLLVSNAGLHEAIGKSARVAPAAIRDEVRALYVRAQRGDLSSALSRFADDMDDAIADTVVTALQIADQRAVSDLGAMLAAVATSTRETVAMQLRINAARARTYRTAQLIAVIVAFFVGLLVVTNRGYMEPFGTLAGQLVLTARGRPRRRVDLGDGHALAPGQGAAPAARLGPSARRWSGDDLGRRARRCAGCRVVDASPAPSCRRPGRCARSPTSSSSRESPRRRAPATVRACGGAGTGLAATVGRGPVGAPGRRPRRARPHAGALTSSTSSATP